MIRPLTYPHQSSLVAALGGGQWGVGDPGDRKEAVGDRTTADLRLQAPSESCRPIGPHLQDTNPKMKLLRI